MDWVIWGLGDWVIGNMVIGNMGDWQYGDWQYGDRVLRRLTQSLNHSITQSPDHPITLLRPPS
jgi:hypothetical protein